MMSAMGRGRKAGKRRSWIEVESEEETQPDWRRKAQQHASEAHGTRDSITGRKAQEERSLLQEGEEEHAEEQTQPGRMMMSAMGRGRKAGKRRSWIEVESEEETQPEWRRKAQQHASEAHGTRD